MIKQTRLEGLSYWGDYQPDRGIDFNGFHWKRPEGALLIDPMPLNELGLTKLRELGGARWVLITNAEHLRAGPELKQAFSAQLIAPTEERERLGENAALVDCWFENSEDLPPELRADIRVFPLRGGKSPMEPALYLEPLQALYFADLVRSHETGRLRLLPDPKLTDRALVLSTLSEIPDVSIEAILLGDGDGIYNGAQGALRRFRAELS